MRKSITKITRIFKAGEKGARLRSFIGKKAINILSDCADNIVALVSKISPLGSRFLIEKITIDHVDPSIESEKHVRHSRALSKSTFLYLGYAFFCLVTLATPTNEILVKNSLVRLPFANVEILYGVFLFVGPLILIAINMYLYVQIGEWEVSGGKYKEINDFHLFNINKLFPQTMIYIIWYYLTPITMSIFLYRSFFKGDLFYYIWGVSVIYSFIVLAILFRYGFVRLTSDVENSLKESLSSAQYIKIMNSIKKSKVFCLFHFVFLTIFVIIFLFSFYSGRMNGSFWVFSERTIDLFEADLRKKDLRKVVLVGANLTSTNFFKANLSDSDLRYAYFNRTNLTSSNLTRANLTNARFIKTNFSSANLTGANFEGAFLEDAIAVGCDQFRIIVQSGGIIKGENNNRNCGQSGHFTY